MAGRLHPVQLSWRRRRIPVAERTRRQRVMAYVGGVWDVSAWAFVALLSVVAVSRRVGGTAPTLLQPLQAVVPLLFLPIYVILAGALVTRRWMLAVTAVLFGLVHWFSVAPARGTDDRPYWLGRGASITVAEANLYEKNPTLAESIANLRAADADVVVVVEVTQDADAAMAAAGLYVSYPYRVVEPIRGAAGSAILSKLPLTDVGRLTRNRLPIADITLPDGQKVRIVAVHPMPPLSGSRSAKEWTEDLGVLRRYAARTVGPVALVGDFNGTRWQPAFGSLLHSGLRDAHEATGKGLTNSWPADRFRRLVRLDHALVGDQLFPTAVTDVQLPGSDHLGFVATFDVRPQTRPGTVDAPADPSATVPLDATTSVPDSTVATDAPTTG